MLGKGVWGFFKLKRTLYLNILPGEKWLGFCRLYFRGECWICVLRRNYQTSALDNYTQASYHWKGQIRGVCYVRTGYKRPSPHLSAPYISWTPSLCVCVCVYLKRSSSLETNWYLRIRRSNIWGHPQEKKKKKDPLEDSKKNSFSNQSILTWTSPNPPEST